MIERLRTVLPKGSFVRNVGILTSGTVVAQGVMALALPILTRLYSPADFNLFAAYASTLGFISVASCLRFNIAISLPDNDAEGMNLLAIALLSGAGFTLLTTVPVVFFSEATAALIGQPAMQPFLWLVPVGVFVASGYDALQYWASRKKRFGLITATRMSRSIAGAGSQLGLGAVSPSPFGLIFGHALYSGLGIVGLARSVLRDDLAALAAITPAGLLRTARTYRKFPMYSVPEAVFNAAGVEVAILIIAAVALGPEAGFLMLAMRVMGLPMGLVGSSVGQVYLAEAPQRLRDGELGAFTRRTMWMLFKVGAPPLLLAGIVSPFLFPIVFGAEWGRAGEILAWLTPMFILQLVASPVSMVPHIMGRLAWAMWLQIIGGVLRVGLIALVATQAPSLLVETFAISGAVFYLFLIISIHAFVKGQRSR